jgi:voltage-gated potassium channel
MHTSPAGISWRQIRASWRDTILLLREFRQPIFLFTLAVTGSGWLYYFLSQHAQNPVNSIQEGIYIALTMTFFQSSEAFPTEGYLQVFFFVMPVVGISILALGLADFGILLFNRRLRGKEWEMAVASTFSNHVVLVGLGHLGYRVVIQLNQLDQDVVAIELAPRPDLLENVRSLGVPVIEDDGTRESVLLAAGVPRARTIMLCTQEDSLNLQMALKARSLNPKIEVVIRIFDNDFAASLQSQFGFHALSATGMAAPLFAAMAADVDITPPITIEGQAHILARLNISPDSHLKGMTVNQLEESYRVSIILICSNGQQEFHPRGDRMVFAGQTVAIFGKPEQINRLMHENHR